MAQRYPYILVVEDHPPSLNNLVIDLDKAGYTVRGCSSYEYAQNHLSPADGSDPAPYAAIISDHNLGNGSHNRTGVNVWQFANRALSVMPPFLAMSSEMEHWDDLYKAVGSRGKGIHLVPKVNDEPDIRAILAKLKELGV